MLNIEGLGRQLYPQLNLWDTAKPFLEEWLADRYSLQTITNRLQQDVPALIETLPILPDLILNRLRQTPSSNSDRRPRSNWLLPLTAAGALTLGLGIANAPGNSWLIVSLSFFIAALFARSR